MLENICYFANNEAKQLRKRVLTFDFDKFLDCQFLAADWVNAIFHDVFFDYAPFKYCP